MPPCLPDCCVRAYTFNGLKFFLKGDRKEDPWTLRCPRAELSDTHEYYDMQIFHINMSAHIALGEIGGARCSVDLGITPKSRVDKSRLRYRSNTTEQNIKPNSRGTTPSLRQRGTTNSLVPTRPPNDGWQETIQQHNKTPILHTLAPSTRLEYLSTHVNLPPSQPSSRQSPLQLSHGGGKHLTTLPQPSHSLALWGRAFFIAEIMYLLTLCFAKLSMTFLLLRFSSSSRLITWLLYSTAALITSLTLAFALWATFQCTPVQSQWDPSVQSGGCASKKSYMISVYVLSAFSAATDIIMAVVPVFILRRLEIDRRTKVAAGVTMGLGSLACIATLIRFKYIRDFSISEDLTCKPTNHLPHSIHPFPLLLSSPPLLYNPTDQTTTDTMVPLSITSFIEVSLACICASLATLRPLLQKLGLGSKSMAGGAGAAADVPRTGCGGVEGRRDTWVGLGSSESSKKGVVEMEVFGWFGGGRQGNGNGNVELVVLGSVEGVGKGGRGGGWV
ncbi:hypothetical protein Q7P36_008802 [Cladosporium allicinum]